MTDRKMLPPDPLSPPEQANLDRMGDHVWIHVGHGKWTAADTAAGTDVLTSRQIVVLWRGGWIEKADHVGARRAMKRSDPPGIPEGVLRC